jgi:hypothetical protein
LNSIQIRYIRLNYYRKASEIFDFRSGLFRAVRAALIMHNHIRAVTRQTQRNRAANAATRTGYKSDFIF